MWVGVTCQLDSPVYVKAVVIRTYGSANRLDAIRTYISTNIRRRLCAANNDKFQRTNPNPKLNPS